jgi:predicted RNA-binding protein YlqC (UPF0109 family)
MVEVIEELARRLVDDRDAVRVERIDDAEGLLLRLHVAPDDVGKVIGRQGRIIRALRIVARATAGGGGRRVQLEIAD